MGTGIIFRTIFRSLLLIFVTAALAACSTFGDKNSAKSERRSGERNYSKKSNDDSLEYFEKGEYEVDKTSSYNRKQTHWTKKYVGVSGYFKRPPLFSSQAEAKKYNRCSPLKIVRFNEGAGEVTLIAVQQGEPMKIVGLNRNLFTLSPGQRLPDIDRHFVKNLDIVNSSRKLARAEDYLCKGQAWKYMTKEQFLFINGKPDRVLKGKGKYRNTFQWVYKSEDRSQKKSYYFTNGLLWAWN